MGLEEIASSGIDESLSIDTIMDQNFNGNGKKGFRAWMYRTFEKPVRKSMHWMKDRKIPDNGNSLDYLHYAAKWTSCYGFVSLGLGDQRPTRQYQIEKAINLKKGRLSLGNVVVGALLHVPRVYKVEGALIAPVASYAISSCLRYFDMNESADFVDKHAREMWLAGYAVVYAIPRLIASLVYKKATPGIGIYKTLPLFIGIEGKEGMIESYRNTKKLFKTTFSRKQGSQYVQ